MDKMTDKLAETLRELFETWLNSRPSFRTTVEVQAAWEGWKANTAVAAMLAEHDAQAAQAAQPVGVPVGWAKEYGRETLVSWSKEAPEHGKGWWPLYTQPPAQPSADAEELDNYRWLKRCTAGQWDALNDSRLHGRLDETVKAARAKEKGE